MPPLDLSALLTPTPTGQPNRFVLDVPDGLQQGRGAWGGVATGAMVSAATQVDPRPELGLRTLSAQLVAPLLVGQAHVEVESLRLGSATHTLAIRLLDGDGGLVAHGVAVLGAPRGGDAMPDGPAWLTVTPPAELSADPESVPVLPAGLPLAPDFLQQLEVRAVTGLPYSGAGHTEVSGWVRPLGPLGRVDAAVVAALADAWWVAVLAGIDRPRPLATLGYTLDLPGDPVSLQRDADGRLEPLFHRGRVIGARQGFTVETRELWTRDGQLVSWNTQTVAVIA